MIRLFKRLLRDWWDWQSGPSKEDLILQLLSDGEESGRELVKKSNGRLSRGGIYTTLARMEERGLISARNVEKHVTYDMRAVGRGNETHLIKTRFYRRGYPSAKSLKPV